MSRLQNMGGDAVINAAVISQSRQLLIIFFISKQLPAELTLLQIGA
jgi:hypothetical protein